MEENIINYLNTAQEDLEYEKLIFIKYVDKISIYETEDDLLELLNYIRPHIRFVGSDWENKPFTGKLFSKINGKIFYNKRYGYSTTDLRGRVADQWYITED